MMVCLHTEISERIIYQMFSRRSTGGIVKTVRLSMARRSWPARCMKYKILLRRWSTRFVSGVSARDWLSKNRTLFGIGMVHFSRSKFL